MYRHAIKAVLGGIIFLVVQVQAMNFLRPYDALYWRKRPAINSITSRIFAETEIGHDHSFNKCGDRVNVLQIYGPEQNSIAMLDGAISGGAIDSLRQALAINSDDPINGQFCVRGQLQLIGAGALTGWMGFHDQFALSLYLPFFGMRLKDVKWCDQTEDELVKALLTDHFFENVSTLGGLSLGGWNRHGLGDLVGLVHWFRDFPQYRPLLKMVSLNARLGLSIPTGLKQDEDKIMAIPFGYDGALGILFAGGLDARIGRCMQVGFDVELLQLFGNTRNRRIKTDTAQTELLLLHKTCAYKDFGFTQKFSLYLQVDNVIKNTTLLFGYQFFKHDADKLWLETQEFSQEVANTTQQLEEYTMHQILAMATYSIPEYKWSNAIIEPNFNIYVRAPVNGRNATMVPVFGVSLSVTF